MIWSRIRPKQSRYSGNSLWEANAAHYKNWVPKLCATVHLWYTRGCSSYHPLLPISYMAVPLEWYSPLILPSPNRLGKASLTWMLRSQSPCEKGQDWDYFDRCLLAKNKKVKNERRLVSSKYQALPSTPVFSAISSAPYGFEPDGHRDTNRPLVFWIYYQIYPFY